MAYSAAPSGKSFAPAESATTTGTYTIELPTWADGSWDEATIEGKLIPGLVKVEPTRGVKYDVKEAPGATGAKVTFKGFEAATFAVIVRLWTATQEAAFKADILPLIEPTSAKDKPKGYAFIHPATALRQIDGILITKVDGPKIQDDAQFVEWKIDAFEFRKPVPQQGGPPGPGLTPCQQARAMFDQKAAEFRTAQSALEAIENQNSEEAFNAAQRVTAARDAMENQANVLEENKCNEASGGSSAAAGNTPNP